MTPRHDIIEVFSTFVQFASDRFAGWAVDPKLRRNMQYQMTQTPAKHSELDAVSNPVSDPVSDTVWALYWHRVWQTQPQNLALGHLSAYLQEPCYWIAQKMAMSLTGVPYRVSDYFQLAIADVPNILRDYRTDYGASLATYARLSFGNIIRDMLRQQREADSRTDWGLLRMLSQKRFMTALQAAGWAAEKIASAELAWLCFKTFGASQDSPATRKLAKPGPKDWEAIAQLYNSQRLRQLSPTSAALHPAQLEQLLTQCAKQVRAYLHPPTTSLNLNKWDEGVGEIQDDLTDPAETPLANLILQEEMQERQAQRTQIGEVLATALGKLNAQQQTLLTAYYGQGLTQQQIAQQLDQKQYTISRRLSSARAALLLALSQWSQATLHMAPTSTAVKQMSLVLEDWLQAYYSQG